MADSCSICKKVLISTIDYCITSCGHTYHTTCLLKEGKLRLPFEPTPQVYLSKYLTSLDLNLEGFEDFQCRMLAYYMGTMYNKYVHCEDPWTLKENRRIRSLYEFVVLRKSFTIEQLVNDPFIQDIMWYLTNREPDIIDSTDAMGRADLVDIRTHIANLLPQKMKTCHT